MEKPTLRAQACRFRRMSRGKKPGAWEPGIAFLEVFNVSDVSFIVDVMGKTIAQSRLYDYNLLQRRVDGYITIKPADYVSYKISE